MDGIKLFKYDLIKSFKCNIGVLIAFVVILIIGDINYYKSSERLLDNTSDKMFSASEMLKNTNESNKNNISFADMIMWNFRGMEIIKKRSDGTNEDYEIPYIIIGLAVVFSFITANYAFRNDNPVIICHARNRRLWLLSKCLCNIILISVFYALIIPVSWLFTRNNSGSPYELNKILLYREMKIKQCTFVENAGNMVLYMIVIPLLVAYTISLIQMMVSVVTSSIVGFLVSMSLYILALFYPKNWMIGNGFMVQRSFYFEEKGVSPLIVLCWCGAMALVSIILMNYFIRKKDLL